MEPEKKLDLNFSMCINVIRNSHREKNMELPSPDFKMKMQTEENKS